MWISTSERWASAYAFEKKIDSKCDLLGANQELRRPPPRLLRDEPRGGIRIAMPASHEIGGCLPSSSSPNYFAVG